MQLSAILLLAYGILVAAGGVMGYARAGSRASLATGGASGLVVIAGALAALGGRRAGFMIDLAVAIVLAAFFAYRFGRTRKPMPAIPSILLSLAAVAIALLAL